MLQDFVPYNHGSLTPVIRDCKWTPVSDSLLYCAACSLKRQITLTRDCNNQTNEMLTFSRHKMVPNQFHSFIQFIRAHPINIGRAGGTCRAELQIVSQCYRPSAQFLHVVRTRQSPAMSHGAPHFTVTTVM